MNRSIPNISTDSKVRQRVDRPEATSQDPKIRFAIGDKKCSVNPRNLTSENLRESIRKKCESASHSTWYIEDILRLLEDVRLTILDFLVSLPNCKFVVGGKQYDNLLSAVLQVPVNRMDPEQMRALKQAALEAACLLHPTSLDIACNSILVRLRELKITGVTIKSLLADAREMLSQLRRTFTAPCTDQISVLAAVPDAPVSDNIVIPAGWQMTPDLLQQAVGRATTTTIHGPVLITRRLVARDGTESLELAWRRDAEWHRKIVCRRDVMDQKEIVPLAKQGLPVSSINARTLVQFLEEFEAANLKSIPRTQLSSQLGWQGNDGEAGFLWGPNLITSETIASNGMVGQSSSPIQFRVADEGTEQLASGFRQRGNLEGWLEAIRPLANLPWVLLGLYAGFVPPMLRILHTKNFVVDFAGQTSQGKTTLLRLIASIYGNPDEGSRDSILGTWSGTQVWRERAAALFNDLPFLMDDTKNVYYRNTVADTIYSVVQGRGRGRGTPEGIARQDHWRTVLFSSGEESVLDFSRDGGTRPRTLACMGSPFGATDPNAGQLTRELTAQVSDHFGLAGPLFIQWLQRKRDQWGEWRERYLKTVRFYENKAGENHFAGRMAASFAAIVRTSKLVHEALEMPWQWSSPILPLWDALVANSGDADMPARALEYVYTWAAGHRDDFFYRGRSLSEQPHGGWAGRWDRDGQASLSLDKGHKWEWLGILPGVLAEVLREGRFDEQATIRAWKERGWLKTDDNKRNTLKTKLGAELPRVIAILRKAVEK